MPKTKTTKKQNPEKGSSEAATSSAIDERHPPRTGANGESVQRRPISKFNRDLEAAIQRAGRINLVAGLAALEKRDTLNDQGNSKKIVLAGLYGKSGSQIEQAAQAKQQELTGIPFDLANAALAELSIATCLPTLAADSPIRRIVMAAVEAAYQRGLREGQDVGTLMVETSEELSARRMNIMTHINVMATLLASFQPNVMITGLDMQKAAWAVGAGMLRTRVEKDGTVFYEYDGDEVEAGHRGYVERVYENRG